MTSPLRQRVCLAALLCASACSESEAATPPNAAHAAATAPGASTAPVRGYLGIVTSSKAVDIVSNESGVVEAFAVELGDVVEVNATLARVDTPNLRAELDMARAAEKAQRAAAARSSAAAKEAARQARADRDLAAKGYISADAARSAAASRRQASAAVSEAASQRQYEAARVRQLQERLANTTLRAPFAGRVAARYVDPGSAVSPGTRVLRLVSGGDLIVRFAVPADDPHGLNVGEEVWLCREGAAAGGTAVVRHRAPEIDAASGMVFYEGVVAAIDSPLPGERVRVVVKARGRCP